MGGLHVLRKAQCTAEHKGEVGLAIFAQLIRLREVVKLCFKTYSKDDSMFFFLELCLLWAKIVLGAVELLCLARGGLIGGGVHGALCRNCRHSVFSC